MRLLFSGDDVVSVVSLAANAWEIIDYFCRTTNVDSMSQQARKNLSADKRLKVDYINSPYRNFFKHAENDADAELPPVQASFVDGLVFLAVEDYLRWSKAGPVEFQVFQLWYLCVYVEKVASAELSGIIEAANTEFPNIRNLPRHDQLKLGLQVLQDAACNAQLLSDPGTESSIKREVPN